MRSDGPVIRFEESRCVWKLDCPLCGWLLGFCLDLPNEHIAANPACLVDGVLRAPSNPPRLEGTHTFLYFKPHDRCCARCKAVLIPEEDLDEWLSSRNIKIVDYDELTEFLQTNDPSGDVAMICSDRVYDLRFEEWGVDGMPSRYVAVKDEVELIRRLGQHA